MEVKRKKLKRKIRARTREKKKNEKLRRVWGDQKGSRRGGLNERKKKIKMTNKKEIVEDGNTE